MTEIVMRFNVILAAFALTCSMATCADENGNYVLSDGFIKFNAPPSWPVMMEKAEGNPQFVAFQVKDPADTGTGESARVSVDTKLLDAFGLMIPPADLLLDFRNRMHCCSPGAVEQQSGNNYAIASVCSNIGHSAQ